MNILQECQGASRIAITGHVRPDGDCVGSCLALYQYLQKKMPQARVQVYLERPGEIYQCIKGCYKIDSQCEDTDPYDVFFVLDSVPERMMEPAKKLYDMARKTINIDHHVSNPGCGDVNYVDAQASSTSELVFDVMDMEELDVEIAKAIYIGIIHDTGALSYSNTSPKTLEIVGKLISFGFDFSEVIEKTFYQKTYVQNLLLGRALLESIQFMDGKCVVSGLAKKTLDFYHADSKDLDGIVSHLNQTAGVECAIFMYQTGVQEYKVSLRSKGNVDVAKLAVFFGGGGHVRAAGCTMKGTFHDVVNNLSLHIERQLKAAGIL